jgi:hypothetical protein
MCDKDFPLDVEIVKVGFFHPASESRIGEVESWPLHGIDTHALLTAVTPFFP